MASESARPEWKIHAAMANTARMLDDQVDIRLGLMSQTFAA
jgi:hypothetical protein